MTSSISSQVPDWTREQYQSFWEPGKKLLSSIRRYQQLQDKSGVFSKVLSKITVMQYRFWSVVTGSDIPLNSQLGGGLMITHPNGIVIHPQAQIGPNCLIFQQVTIGAKGDGVPIIGGHVDIGAGAKIIGKITIGNHVRIGANAVVLNDVPDGCDVAGIPAKIISRQ